MTQLKTQQDYTSQGDISLELAAQNENNNLVQIDLSLEAKTFLAYKYKTASRDKLLKKLERANPNSTKQILKKSKFICKQAVELAETVLAKILSCKRVLLNHKYISKITECDSTDQNKRILDQLDNFFIIKYHRLAIVDGIPYNYHYSFELHPAIIEELKAAGLWDLEFIPAEMRLSYNNRPYIFSKNIIRSNVHTHGSNYSNNFNSNNSLSESVKTTETKIAATESAEAKVLVSKKKFKLNARKKPTAAERKANKARIYKFKQYDKPKTLAEIEPITESESKILQDKSGRNFTLVFQNELLQDLSRKLHRAFESRWQFLNYFAKVLHGEKRDEVKCAGLNFYIKARKTEEELAKHITQSQREKYMKQEEDAGIFNRSDYTQFRARIAGGFPINLGYDLLSNMINAKKKDSVFEITMHKLIDLTEHYKQCLMDLAKGIGGYEGVNKLELLKRSE